MYRYREASAGSSQAALCSGRVSSTDWRLADLFRRSRPSHDRGTEVSGALHLIKMVTSTFLRLAVKPVAPQGSVVARLLVVVEVI